MTGAIWVLLMTGGVAALLAAVSRRRFEEWAAPAVFLLTGAIYVFALAGAPELGCRAAQAMGLLSLLAAAVLAVRSREARCRILTPGAAAFALVVLVAGWAHRGQLYTLQDEFSHWGRVVNRLCALGTLPHAVPGALDFPSYPPGAALWEYAWVVLSGGTFSEGATISANNVALAVCFLPLMRYADWRRWKRAVPLLLGFGCSVPGVLAARTLPTRRDRALTIVLTPCMSCSAKAPVYAAFAAAFFPGRSAVVFLALYALGILAAAVAARLLGRTALRGEAASFVMELPDYRWPNARSVLRRMWVRTREFLTRAFTIILAASVGVWVLRTFTPTWRVAANAGESLLAVVGQALAPVFAPLGFGDWRAATALVTGLLAKETVLSTLGVLLGGDLTAALPGVFSPAAAASYLVFTALYAPCVAAQAAMRQELGSMLGTLAAAAGSCAAAWCAAAVVYRIAILI